MKIGRQFLNNRAKGLLLDEFYPLEAMRQLHRQGDTGWTQQYILVCLIIGKDTVAVSGAEEIKLGKLASKLIEIVQRDSTIVNLVKTTLTFAIKFEKSKTRSLSQPVL